MPYPNLGNSFLNACVPSLGRIDPGLLVLIGITTFIANIAVPAIIKEYVIRFWRRWVHADEIDRLKKEIGQSRQALEAERAEFEATKDTIVRIICQNERLRDELLRLQRLTAGGTASVDAGDIGRLREQLSASRAALTEMQADYEAAKNAIKQLLSENERLRSEILRLQSSERDGDGSEAAA
jgi:regulator of replication initiation timing